MIFNSVVNGGDSIDTSLLTAAPPQVLDGYKFVGKNGVIQTGSLDPYSEYFGASSTTNYSDFSRLQIFSEDSSVALNEIEIYPDFDNGGKYFSKYPRFVSIQYFIKDDYFGSETWTSFIPTVRPSVIIIPTSIVLIAVDDKPTENDGTYLVQFNGWSTDGPVGFFDTITTGYTGLPTNTNFDWPEVNSTGDYFKLYINSEAIEGVTGKMICLPYNKNNHLGYSVFTCL